MSIQCQDLLSFKSFKRSSVLAGHEGMNRIIRWVYICDILDDAGDIINWLYGNELIIISERMLGEDCAALLDIMPQLNEINIAGILIDAKDKTVRLSDEIVRCANELKIPVFSLPWEVKLINFTRDVCYAITMEEVRESQSRDLLETILFDPAAKIETIEQMSGGKNAELLRSENVVGILEVNLEEVVRRNHLNNPLMPKDLMEHVLKRFNSAFAERHIKALTLLKSDAVIFLTENTKNTRKSLQDIVKQVYLESTSRAPGLYLRVGVGNAGRDLEQLRESYLQAQKTIRYLSTEKQQMLIGFYREIGLHSILLGVKDEAILKDYYQDIFHELLYYDQKSESDLFRTLEIYYQTGFQTQKTAEKLYIHKNTLKYRLGKIAELIGCDLREPEAIVRIGLGLKIVHLLTEDQSKAG